MPKQIGWSNESNLLYQISQQITRLINVTGTNGGGGGGSITGSGTTNYVSKWTSSSALGSSLIYDNGSFVGIGTTTPIGTYKLVTTDMYCTSLFSNTFITTNFSQAGFFKAVSGNIVFGKNDYVTRVMTIFESTGNVLIGSGTSEINSAYKLQVNGGILLKNSVSNFKFTLDNTYDLLTLDGSSGNIMYISGDAYGNITFANGSNTILGGKVGIGSLNPYTLDYQLTVAGAASILTTLRINSIGSANQSLIKLGYQEGYDRLLIGYLNSGTAISNNIQAAQIIVDDNGNINLISRSDNASGIRFSATSTTSSGFVEAMRVTNDGSLLIGTTAPIFAGDKLSVLGVVRSTNLVSQDRLYVVNSGASILSGNLLVNRDTDDGTGAILQVNGTTSTSGIGIAGGIQSGFKLDVHGATVFRDYTYIINAPLFITNTGTTMYLTTTTVSGLHSPSSNYLPIQVNGVTYYLQLLN